MSFPPKDLTYPVFAWGSDFIFRGMNYGQLVNIDRRTLKTRLDEQAKSGKCGLVDATGTRFKVIGYSPVKYGNIIFRLLGAYHAEPILTAPEALTLEEFKDQMTKAIWQRGRYDTHNETLYKTKPGLEAARTYEEAIMALPKLY